jgi:hypothetical protein
LFSELTGDDLYTEMVMQRTNDARNFLIVEGDGDIAIFDRFLAPEHFVAIPASGKKSAREVLQMAFRDNFEGIYSVLDRDWKDLLPGEIEDWRIVYTDQYDMDMCVFFSGAYLAVASGYCTRGGYRTGNPGCSHDEIVQKCLQMAFPIGVLRYISARDRLELKLRDFPLHEVVDASAFSVDIEAMVSAAHRRSKGCATEVDVILETLRTEMESIEDTARYCSGHDVARAFSILSRNLWSTVMPVDNVERAARTAVSLQTFKDFSVYEDCSRWFGGDPAMVWRV